MDDILVHGSIQEQHDLRLRKVLERIKTAGVTLNKQKSEFGKTTVRFLGHIIDQEGSRADPEKIASIETFPEPKNRKELRRFFGMVNYLGKFSPLLSEKTGALREL